MPLILHNLKLLVVKKFARKPQTTFTYVLQSWAFYHGVLLDLLTLGASLNMQKFNKTFSLIAFTHTFPRPHVQANTTPNRIYNSTFISVYCVSCLCYFTFHLQENNALLLQNPVQQDHRTSILFSATCLLWYNSLFYHLSVTDFQNVPVS